VDVSVANQEIHEGVDFPGSFFNVENGEVGIENGKQDNEKEGDEEIMAIEVDIYMGFSIRSPPNRSTATEEHISAERFRWLLPSLPYYSSILFQ
jgi:hypothetical protein